MTAATLPTHSLRRDAEIIGLVGLAHGCSHFFHLALPSLFPWLKDAFSLSYAELGLLMSVFFVVSGAGQALAGFVVDRVGALVVLLSGIALLGISAVGLSLSPNYATLLLFAAVAGLGNSVFHPADFTVLNRRVSQGRLGHAFSTHGIAGNIGWAISPVFMAGIATISSWRVALLCAAVVAFAVLATLIACRHLLDTREVEASVAHAAHGKHAGGTFDFLRLRGVWMCFGFFFITAMSLAGIQTFAPTALHEQYGMPVALASACITVFMLASATGMVLGGFLAARTYHHERIIAWAFAIAAALAVLVGTAPLPVPLVVVLFGAIGFGSGIAGPSRDLMVRAAAPRHATGRVYGVVYSGLDVGLSISPPLFGALMDAHRPGGVFVLIGVFQALAIFTALGIGGSTARARALAPTS